MKELFLIIIGFSEGLIVGVALVAFLMVLDIIPRLIHLSNSREYTRIYQSLIITGSFLATLISFFNLPLPRVLILNKLLVIFLGLIMGIFIGLLAAALTEVLKVLPILSHRLGLKDQIKELLVLIILGKMIGSLLFWLFPTLWNF